MFSQHKVHVVCGQIQPCASAKTNPTPHPTQPQPFERAKVGVGAAARLRHVPRLKYSENKNRRPKGQSRSIRQTTCTKFCAHRSRTVRRARLQSEPLKTVCWHFSAPRFTVAAAEGREGGGGGYICVSESRPRSVRCIYVPRYNFSSATLYEDSKPHRLCF